MPGPNRPATPEEKAKAKRLNALCRHKHERLICSLALGHRGKHMTAEAMRRRAGSWHAKQSLRADMERLFPLAETRLTKAENNFIAFLEETLIPDLQDSGTVETAKDFVRCVKIMRRLGGL